MSRSQLEREQRGEDSRSKPTNRSQLDELKVARLRKMLDWRLTNGSTFHHEAEAEALAFALDIITHRIEHRCVN